MVTVIYLYMLRFTILEKHSCVGGTWNINRYPGCACDVPSNFYCFSFLQVSLASNQMTATPSPLRTPPGAGPSPATPRSAAT